MAEKIYTIPVNEAFDEDCECSVCLLEKRFENELTAFFLGPSLMEPDNRVETNDKGFCGRHFEMLYNSEKNRLGLALILETHYAVQIARLEKAKRSLSSDAFASAMEKLSGTCALCDKLTYTMERYIDVIFYLWKSDPAFRRKIDSGHGFCLRHYAQLLSGVKKYLSKKEAAEFIEATSGKQIENLKRIQADLLAFARKFDYRFADEPWGTAKDAIPRAIEKLTGYRKFD